MTLSLNIPELETERLRLRAPAPADFEPMAAFWASDRARFVGGVLTRMQAWRAFAAQIGHWALNGYGHWSVEERATGAYVGRVGLWFPETWPEPEIGWTLMDGCEGRGFATEAARAARRHAYDTLGWSTAISLIDPENLASQAVATRLGCARDGVFHHPEGWRADIWRHPAAEETAA